MWKSAEEFLLQDKYIAPLIKKYGHCTMEPRDKKYYFEDLVDAIVQQQLSMKAASSIFNRLKEALISQNKAFNKNSVEHKWRKSDTIKVKITPDRIIKLADETLRGCGLSRAKAIYLKDLSGKALSGELQIESMDKLPDEEIIEKLVMVKGIGEWTAHMFLMFTLGRPDIFPSRDLGLRNAFEKVVKKGQNRKQMEEFAKKWKPYRTIASWYLWRALEN